MNYFHSKLRGLYLGFFLTLPFITNNDIYGIQTDVKNSENSLALKSNNLIRVVWAFATRNVEL